MYSDLLITAFKIVNLKAWKIVVIYQWNIATGCCLIKVISFACTALLENPPKTLYQVLR